MRPHRKYVAAVLSVLASAAFVSPTPLGPQPAGAIRSASSSIPSGVHDAASSAWREYQFDGGNTGVNPYESIIGPSNVSTLTQLWATDIGGLVGVPASPALANGVLYASPLDEPVLALDSGTGDILWRARTALGTTTPAVARGVVLVGSGIHNRFYAVNARDGRTLWSYLAGAGVFSSPTVSGGVVYFGSTDGYLRVMDVRTGAQVWFDYLRDPIVGSPALVDRVLYVATRLRRWIFALDAATGAIVWERKLNGPAGTASSPIVAGGRVYVLMDNGTMLALDAATGVPLWRVDGLAHEVASATSAIADGIIYVPSREGRLWAIDAETGTILWTSDVADELTSSVSVANGVVYVGSLGGTAYAFDAAKGDVLWTATAGGAISTPIVADGVVYFASFDEHVYAYGLPQG